MALGNERLYSEFTSDQNVTYKISIYDSDYSGSSSEFNVDSTGFELTYKGEGDERYEPIKASTLTFNMYIVGESSQTLAFVDLIQTAEQGRLKLKVQRSTNGGSTYSTYWHGIIVSDIATLEDMSTPFIFKVKAVDGLSLMKDVDFNRDVYNGSNGTLTSLYTFENIVCNFLEYYTGGIVDFFNTTTTFVRELVHWYEDSMPAPISSAGPWEYSAIYPKAFMDISYDGNTEEEQKPISAYKALESILRTFGLRIWQQNGHWWIAHVDMWRNSQTDWYYRRLSYNNVELGSGTQSLSSGQQDLGNVTSGEPLIKLSGGTDSFYPPLKKTIATYGNWTNAGLYTEQLTLTEYSNDATLEAGLIDLGYLDNGDDAYLDFNQRFAFVTNAGGVDYSGYYDSISAVYMLKIGTYYWDGDNNEWTTTQTSFQKPIMPLLYNLYLSTGNWVGVYNFVNISFATQGLPVSGTCEFNVQFIQENSNLVDSYYDYTVVLNAYSDATPSIIQYLRDGESVNERIFASEDVSSTANEVMDLGEMRLGDGPTTTAPSWGRIRIYDGSSWQNTIEENWQAWETGTQGRITKILTEQNFTGQRDFLPLRQYKFRVDSSVSFGPLISLKDTTNSNEIMVMNGYRFTANTDTVEGEYFKTTQDATGVTITLEESIDWGIGELNGNVELF